jgi:CRP-like cAMP-binding protein
MREVRVNNNHSENRILSSVSPEIFAALKPHLSVRELISGEILGEVGASVREAFFPLSGIISLVVELSVGQMVETAMVGRDGVVNASAALDGKISLYKAVVQLTGVSSVISVARLAEVADSFRDLRSILIRHEQVLFAQAQQSSACNASHAIETRLCRWLLRSRDLAASDDLSVTQEFLSQMLGVQRSSLSVVAHTLQQAGLIRYKRGHVHIVNVDGLKESACECYEAVNGQYDRIFKPL